MNKLGLFALACATLVVGCGKTEPVAPAAAPPVAKPAPAIGATETAPAAEVPAPGAEATAAQPAPIIDSEIKEDPGILTKSQALDLVVNDFISQYGRPPRNLEELVTLKVIPRLPAAPAGKKFALNKENQVVLENQ